MTTHYINGQWIPGSGHVFSSHNPATNEAHWEGKTATAKEVNAAVEAARTAFNSWQYTTLEARIALVRRFRDLVQAAQGELAEIIARDTGKVLWDAKGEAAAVVAKVETSIKAYSERTGLHESEANGIEVRVAHRPHGVMAVFAPYNFPAHLPNGHIVPALIAGNTVVLKQSEHTPLVGARMAKFWEEAGAPKGVVNLVQGERDTGVALAGHGDIDGLLFTGSSEVGAILHKQFAGAPHKILALEMGGNNPLVVWDAGDVKAAAYHAIQSAFLTTGQRCSCSRRIIIPQGKAGDDFLDAFLAMTKTIRVGAYNAQPEPFMGPLINKIEAEKILVAQQNLQGLGGKILLEVQKLDGHIPYLTPGIVDITTAAGVPDREYFGPLTQIIRVADFDAALRAANNTQYGLTSGLLSDRRELFERFIATIRAGCANWNRPTTGANSASPYGGVGRSGNHRPAAFYAADYCAWPIASQSSATLALPAQLTAGVEV